VGSLHLEFADGGRLALKDKRRLGRALLEPDFSHIGPDAAEVSRDEFRKRISRSGAADQGTAHGSGRDLGNREPARRRGAVAGPDVAVVGRLRRFRWTSWTRYGA
jgi:formamidopyrimidine-DNA glycosylase